MGFLMDKLEELQRRAACIIMRSDSSDIALNCLKYDTLEVRIKMS